MEDTSELGGLRDLCSPPSLAPSVTARRAAGPSALRIIRTALHQPARLAPDR